MFVRSLSVEYTERGKEFGILSILSPFCQRDTGHKHTTRIAPRTTNTLVLTMYVCMPFRGFNTVSPADRRAGGRRRTGDRSLRVQYKERGEKYGILVIFRLFCQRACRILGTRKEIRYPIHIYSVLSAPGPGAYVSNARSEERNTISGSYVDRGRSLRVEYAGRGEKYGILFICNLFCQRAYVSNTRSEEKTVSCSYVDRGRSLRVEYAERGEKYGFLFIFICRLFCQRETGHKHIRGARKEIRDPIHV